MTALDRLAEIQARADKATGGPWHEGEGMSFVRARIVYDMVTDNRHVTTSHVLADVTRNHDAEFIAHSRTDVPRLVAALRAVLALHVEIEYPFPDDDESPIRGCSGCGGREWPCPTVRAVEAALGEAS